MSPHASILAIATIAWTFSSSVLALPSPLMGNSTLSVRQDDPLYGGQLNWGSDTCKGMDGHEAYITFSICNTCETIDEEGNVDCTRNAYVSTTDTPGNYGTKACTDPSISKTMDPCTAVPGYSISTPSGFASYTPNGNCGTTGAVCGTLNTAGGYEMSCTALADPYNVDCGEQFACNTNMQCVGVQNADVCP